MIDKIISKLLSNTLPTEAEIYFICDKVAEFLFEEGNIVVVYSPVTLCGDIHGQFYDLLHLFKINKGMPPDINYLFLGDYVDRGYDSIETITLLLSLKVRYPDRIVLLRGNHESRQITQTYGFYDECSRKYNNNMNIWRAFTEVFDYLPLAALVDNNIFCVHGGLSPAIDHNMNNINFIERKREVPQDGPMADLLWSDPDEFSHNENSPENLIDDWGVNARGAGFLFGEIVTKKFCYFNSISLICRAHQLVMEGFKSYFTNNQVCTVWSAPNYCYRCGNTASTLSINYSNISESSPSTSYNYNILLFNATDYNQTGDLAKYPPPEYFL